MDPETLEKLTADPGLSVESLCQQLAAHLPKAISHLGADGGNGSDEAAESNRARQPPAAIRDAPPGP
ncbi:MAG: hypothetical protein ACYCT1_06300 [Steroidobacteraceae bacterium]